jgi:hypothetical protein
MPLSCRMSCLVQAVALGHVESRPRMDAVMSLEKGSKTRREEDQRGCRANDAASALGNL